MAVTELTEFPAPRGTGDDAGTVRWRPSRAGVLNVWRYYDEVFAFHRGRLLLRGPNGTGKSKALEVLLPFLFDGSLKPHRLSTFGGSERTMHWNLMGEGASGVTRVGYVWLEFRLDRGGATQWFTIGARLQATTRTTSVGADFFTCHARVGHGERLSLLTDTGRPLSVAALKETLTGRGEVHETAADYRTAVRQTLFPGLSEQRYDALITALLQLRTPKLSERLDPSLLSTLLSRALPQLNREEISELADGFERLDRQREELAAWDERVEAAGRLARRQRSYARRVLSGKASELIEATARLEDLGQAVGESDEAYQAAVGERERTTEKLAEVERLAGELRSRIEVLTESEDYGQGRDLDRLRRQADRARVLAEDRRAAAGAARAEAEEESARAARARDLAAAQRGEARTAEEETWQAARDAGLGAVCTELAAALEAQEDGRARRLVSGAVRGRLDRIAEVRGAVAAHRGAVRARSAAEEALEQARTALAEATARHGERTEAYAETVRAQATRLREWARGCTELRFGPGEPVGAEELAARAVDGTAVLALTEAAARSVERELTAEETAIGRRREALAEERARTADELASLEQSEELPPEPARTRTASRAALPGAPLWKLVVFRETVSAEEQAAVEAALEASGLLDAWVGPFGGLVAPGHDTFAEPEWSVRPLTERNLSDVLRPEPDAPVPAERIGRLLSSIGYGDTLPPGPAAAVGADGTWRLAAATGSWAKPESAYIGAAARQRARRRRIDELLARLAESDAAIRECDSALGLLADRRRAQDRELRARPDHTAVAAARRAVDRAEADTAARDDTVRATASVLADRESDVARALRALDSLAAEHGLPTEDQALDALAEHAETLRESAGQWVLASVRLGALAGAAAEAEERAARAARTAEDRESRAGEADAELCSATAALEEAERTTATPYEDVLTRIGELRAELGRAEQDGQDLRGRLLELAARIGALDSLRAAAAEDRDAGAAQRDSAAGRLRRCLALGLADDARAADLRVPPDAEVAAVVEAARAIAARWPTVPNSAQDIAEALERLAETRYATAQALGERADVRLEATEDVHLLTATVDGSPVGAAGLLAALTEERDRGRDDITAGERGLFDRILTGDTRRRLAARIHQAEELVDAMNARLERVRSTSRLAVQLIWEVDPALPPATRTARDLLLKDPARLTDADHEALHRFFRERVEEARDGQRAGGWEEQLAQVLDYTAWHRFVVSIDRGNPARWGGSRPDGGQGQGWQLLTKKLHGALSGGEKAIALHLPLFAAVAAHYHTVPEAPRLILLDEVFVGVDAANRGQVFALLCSLDLDLLLTSDHEWCTYRELDGIAVHQLITDGQDDAVTTARFVWDGAGLLPEDVPV
ncbi:TIGR02680 family protein [Streptomyces cavernae]|uniref:TIGR02680 family protein n=1 Tax=Streptomyces cavernae TaxID=2259034 RepID=UPI000FEB923E|nr:TIGR02680 family protein [Streptomyces cavernae]